MQNLVSLILGGGKGTRLSPLTRFRSKPAVPLAGKYRIIDIPISNCLNCGLNKIYLLTQFNSVSLHRHIRQSYAFDAFGGGFVELLAAEQTFEHTGWYQGTADAVRKQMRYLEEPGIDYVLILSGDQLYRMDYTKMLKTHVDSGADVTISAVPVPADMTHHFGIMRLDDTGRVKGFLEKPDNDKDREIVRTDAAWLDAHGINSNGREYLASMGIYLFNRDTLVEMLSGSDYEDFGKEVFPLSIRTRHVQMYPYDGYWEDIGTIRAYYDANLALARESPPFRFMDRERPIYTHARYLPSTRIDGATVSSSLIADGCEIGSGTVIENSVIGVRCRIGKNAVIKNSVVMGADYFDDSRGKRHMGIGDGARIDGAILDKNVTIRPGVVIEPKPGQQDDTEFTNPVVMRDGVIIVQKGAVIDG